MKWILSVLTSFFCATLAVGNIEPVEGGALYLKRLGVETLRAEFGNAEDCQLIAKAMSAAEPNVDWYCSTSTEPLNLLCSISNVMIKQENEDPVELGELNFKLSLNRGVATTDLTQALMFFDYNELAKGYVLRNSYPFVGGNYYSAAVSYLILRKSDLGIQVLDINQEPNGEALCELEI